MTANIKKYCLEYSNTENIYSDFWKESSINSAHENLEELWNGCCEKTLLNTLIFWHNFKHNLPSIRKSAWDFLVVSKNEIIYF